MSTLISRDPYRARRFETGVLPRYVSAACFIMGALALTTPSGYSFGPALLLLASPLMLWWRPSLGLDRRDATLMVTLVGYGMLMMAMAWADGLGSRGLDKPSRFLLAVPVALMVLAYPPRLAWLWSGLAVGAMGAGGLAAWQKLIEGVARPGGATQAIQFGNIGLLMGMLCLAGLGWAVMQRHRGCWVVLLLLGALGGMLASLFSGSRGGWVGLPLMLFVLYRAYGRECPPAGSVAALGAVVLVVGLAWSLPQTGVKARVSAAVTQVGQYIAGENLHSSVGVRFEMWRGASSLMLDKPLLGWGETGYEAGMQQLAEAGQVHPNAARFGHAHNEFFDHAAKHGLLGLAALLALYLVPITLFAPGLRAASLSVRALATAGTLIPVGYIDFSLTQGFLAHNSGVMVYAFWVAVIWVCYRAYSD